MAIRSDSSSKSESSIYRKEYWYGHSQDGLFQNIEGYHYYELSPKGDILQAYEYFESDEGEEFIFKMDHFIGINWYHDLGFQDDELLEKIDKAEFLSVARKARSLTQKETLPQKESRS